MNQINWSKWEHKSKRTPDLDEQDLNTIKFLVENYGQKHLPIFCKRLMKKINESLSVYDWEKKIIKEAEMKLENKKNQ